MVIERMRARLRLMRTEKRGRKRLSCLFSCRDSRMNYSRGRRERENINLTLFLNSDFAPRHHSVSNCRPPLPRLLSNKPERRALLKPRLVWFILISKYKALRKTCGFFKKKKKRALQLKGPQWKTSLKRSLDGERSESNSDKYLLREMPGLGKWLFDKNAKHCGEFFIK